MITVTLNPSVIKNRLRPHFMRSQIILDKTVLDDSNKYVREATSEMKNTSIARNVPGTGVVKWTMSYAKFAYNNPRNTQVSKLKNPNARTHWFEWAKTQHSKQWIKKAGVPFT